MAMVPANQVVASMLTSGEAANTPVPIVDTSSSSDQTMSSISHPGPSVSVTHNRVLNQQMNVVTVDPMVIAQASEEVTRAQSEAHRVAVLAGSQVMQTRDEARQIVGRTMIEADLRVNQAQSLVQEANRAAESRVSEAQMLANSTVETVQGQAQSFINQAQNRIHDLETSLSRSLEENSQLRLSLEKADRQFHEVSNMVANLKRDFQDQLRARDDQIKALESNPAPKVQGQSSQPSIANREQVHHGAGLSLPIASGSSSQHQVHGPEMLQCTGNRNVVVGEGRQQGSPLLSISGDDFVKRIFDEVVVPSPVPHMPSEPARSPSNQRGDLPNLIQMGTDPMVLAQLNELAARVSSLTSMVQVGMGQNQVQQPSGSRNPSNHGVPSNPPSPPGSSSSSSSNNGRGGGGGGGTPTPPRGSPASRHSVSSAGSAVDEYTAEKRLMRIKQYDNLKLPPLPKSASDARSFRNSVFNLVCKLAKGDESQVLKWIQDSVDPAAFQKLSISKPYPLLDRVLGSKLLESSKHTRFAMHFQTIQESAQKNGKQPKGRQLLWIIFEKYKMERDRGVALTQNHLLNLKMHGTDIKALEDFRNRFDFVWQALEIADRPSDSSIRSLLFEQLKLHPKMQLTIDKFRNASSTSSKRTHAWLYEKMVEAIEIHQLEENTVSIEKSLANVGQSSKTDAAANAAKPDKSTKQDKTAEKTNKQTKTDKPDKSQKPDKTPKTEKPTKPDKTAEASTNAAAAKGKGKGKDDRNKKSGGKELEDLKKKPCMYYGYNSCTKGDKCPYLHDPNNKYQGPKPRGLRDASGSSNAGAATVIAATSLASSVHPSNAEANPVSSSPNAPQEVEPQISVEDEVSIKGAAQVASQARKACRKFLRSQRSPNGLSRTSMFEKAVKVFSAMVACMNPASTSVNQDFLLDTGAGRNLISHKGMPDVFKDYITEAPEKVQFATGGGIRPSAKAVKLQGNLSGTNTFYALKECPHALSVGIQVNEHRRPFIWLPDQLPYLVKADRVKDMVHHVPDSAKIFADRVEENVPIMSESVCIAMPASSGGSSGSKDPISKEKPVPLLDPSHEPLPCPPTPAYPSDLPRSREPLRLDREVMPHFGRETDEVFQTAEVEREKGDDPIDSDDEESNPWVPSLREKLQKEARSMKHQLTHFPKNRYCEVCRRAKMLAKTHRKRGLEIDPDEIPPLHFGHKLRVDHIIIGRELTKGSEGEQACLVCYDEYSGCYAAYPQTQRNTDQNIQALQKFGGTQAHGKALCVAKSDAAAELTEAISYLGWLPDPAVPNDEMHNAKLERGIRSIKEGVRSIMLKSGLPHQFWPRAIEYFCTAQSFSTQAPIHPNETDESKIEKSTQTCYEAATGETFTGLKLPFGVLVFYKPPKHRELPAFEPRTLPGIFVGWRMDAGFKHRGIHYVLDYESLRTNSKGCGRPIQVYQSELVDPNDGNWVFPLYEAQVAKLQLFSEKSELPLLGTKDALPFEGEAPPPVVRKRRTYVTLERAIKYGKTPGCKGCERIAEGIPHTEACHERFRICLEEERLAAEAKAARSSPSTPAPETPRLPAPETPAVGAKVQCCPRCFNAPDSNVPAAPFVESHQEDKESDHWMFDKERQAWKRVHVRPRKRLYAPTGRDCPFDASDVFTERITEWKCRNRVSVHKDDWQKTPYQRISSKSWVGSTWFYPKKPIDEEKAVLFAVQANLSHEVRRRNPMKCDAMFAKLIAEANDQNMTADHLTKVTRNVPQVKPSKDVRKHRSSNPTCFEFCCSKDSTLGQVNVSRGINHFRLSSDHVDMADDKEVDSLIGIMKQFPGADIFGSIPCDPWSVWQRVNCKRYGKKFQKKLERSREKSLKILRNYIRCAEVILANGGHCAFEWPKGCEGWKIPELLQFIKRHDLFIAEPQGCAFGLQDKDGNPHLKTWWVATSSWKLAVNLDNKRCSHPPEFKHAPLEGNATKKSAFYTHEMAECISNSLYDQAVPAMPVKPFVEEPHNQGGIGPFAAVHLLLERKDWHKHEGWETAIKNEVDGLLSNGVWSYDEVVPREELLSKARENKTLVNVGRLMTILSVKNHESPSLRKLKARIVFRGDDIRTQDNTLAVLQEAKVNPTGLVGLNANLAYGCCKGCKSSQSDVIKAYTQSYLQTQVPTWVELPSELTPPEFAHIKRPCVKLIRALYGHPEAGWHWDKRFREVMELMGGTHLSNFQSSYWFSDTKMLLTLYVDDMVLSGPSENHSAFWKQLSKHLEFEEPSSVDRILGRKQEFFQDDTGSYVAMSMEDFLESACSAYETLTSTKIKEASTPYMPDGSLNTTDWETRGVLAESASRILMKILWAARLCRPDYMKAIGDLTKRLTTWSVADDKRLSRLMGYIKQSTKFRLVGKIGNSIEDLKLSLYTDADHCSGVDHTKSTSGMIMALEGTETWFPLTWASRRQTATARSTTEAEMISLGAGLFGEGIPAQELFETVFQKPVVLECLQDNSAVIAIVSAGYSPKLRHMSKTQRIELGSIYEVFEEAGTVLLYIKTDKQRADPLTKNLQPMSWPEALKLMGITPVSIDHQSSPCAYVHPSG